MATDIEVMRFITGHRETAAQTSAWLERVEVRWQTQQLSWWALLEDGDMVGAAALQHIAGKEGAPIEIGWRLARANFHKGYATEAALAILKYATTLGMAEVYALAHPDNLASQRVMQRIGMRSVGTQIHYDRPCATYLWTAAR